MRAVLCAVLLAFRFNVNGMLSVAKPLREELASVEKEDVVENEGRDGFHSYFYNYLDDLAMSLCASLSNQGPGLSYTVRRKCGEKATCKDLCTHPKLRQQEPTKVQSMQWTCSGALHVDKKQPALKEHFDTYTNSERLRLAIYRHYSCTIGGCGPNYCCCRAS